MHGRRLPVSAHQYIVYRTLTDCWNSRTRQSSKHFRDGHWRTPVSFGLLTDFCHNCKADGARPNIKVKQSERRCLAMRGRLHSHSNGHDNVYMTVPHCSNFGTIQRADVCEMMHGHQLWDSGEFLTNNTLARFLP